MADLDLAPLFAGYNDEQLLFELHHSIRVPCNDSQRTFVSVWEAYELLHSDGFEMLIEQNTSLEEYAKGFATIGMTRIPPIFDRVMALIPPNLRLPQNQEALFEHLQTLFEDLKGLSHAFYDASSDFVLKVADYVRSHRTDFSEYASDNRPTGDLRQD